MTIVKLRMVAAEQAIHDKFLKQLQELYETVLADPTQPYKYGEGLVTYMILDIPGEEG
ncbi:MAG: hypothetical protein ACE5OZ_23160 [Candidatus Heimdallarchaeota archaeon]